MKFTIYRDLPSIAFVRCISPVPGTKYWAEGTSFFVGRAIEKCRSEVLESHFQLAHPLCSKILGIAAHPEKQASEDHAWNEAIETLVIRELGKRPTIHGVSFRFAGLKLILGRVNDRFLALALFAHKGTATATQAVSRNPFKAALKAWTEVRNIRIYNPSPADIPNYTKANRLLSTEQIERISAKLHGSNFIDTRSLRKFQSAQHSHVITYFTEEAS